MAAPRRGRGHPRYGYRDKRRLARDGPAGILDTLHQPAKVAKTAAKVPKPKPPPPKKPRKPRGGTSAFQGVCRKHDKWEAQICTGGKKQYIGIFQVERDAAVAYDAARAELGLEPINFP